MSRRSRWAFGIGLLAITMAAVTVGCAKKVNLPTSDTSPRIPVSHAVVREVTDYADYTGRTDAVLAVNVVARATGYLLHTYFDEGADVKEGDLLFEIDPEPYQIQVDSAAATVRSSQASVDSAKANYDSDLEGRRRGRDIVSDLQLATDKASLDGSIAKLDGAKASLDNAKLNLRYTKVTAPISGQISRYYYTTGNLITANSTLMTTIVSNDYMYAYFDIEERVFEKIISELSKNKNIPKVPVDALAMRSVGSGLSALSPLQMSNFPVLMAVEGQGNIRGEVSSAVEDRLVVSAGAVANVTVGTVFEIRRGSHMLGSARVIEVKENDSTTIFTPLGKDFKSLKPEEKPAKGDVADTSQFRYRGKLDFLNNQVNPSTGTVAVRGYFENPRRGGLASLIPGMFVRIRLPLGSPHKSQLIIDRAISSDQGLKYVYILQNKKDKEDKEVRDEAGNPVKEVAYRRVTPGALQEDGLRVIEPYKPKTGDEIESGIKPDELVIVGGLQQLKPRLTVDPYEIEMPTLTTDVARLKSPLGGKEGAAPKAGDKGGKGGDKAGGGAKGGKK